VSYNAGKISNYTGSDILFDLDKLNNFFKSVDRDIQNLFLISNSLNWTGSLNGTIPQGNLTLASRGWIQDCVFSSTNANTVSWTSGTYTTADGTSYSIDAGDTGAMSALTYIYLDTSISETAYQTTTTPINAVGANRVLLGIAKNSTYEATFQMFYGSGGIGITGEDIENDTITATQIAANTITANEIAANTITAAEIAAATITATELNVSQLSAISADIGSITAGSLVGVTTAIGTGNNIFKATTDGIQLGHATFASAPFRVTMAGAVTASNIDITGGSITGGSVGAWQVTIDTLYSGTGATYIGLKPGTGIWLGDEAFLSAPFSVDPAGVLHAHSGTIGGWYLGTTEIKSEATSATADVVLDQSAGTLRIGDTDASYILIDGANKQVSTSDYVSGALGAGWGLTTAIAEFQNIRARGKLVSTVLEYNTVSVIGGNYLISHDADVLDEDMTAISTDLVTTGDVQFAVGDILWINDGTNQEYMTIATASSITTYTVTRESGGTAVAWKKGTAIANLGQSGDGMIFMTASEATAPYISVITHAGEPWTTLTTHMRMGNLNGYLDYATDLYGIAIGKSDAYLKYDPTNGLRIKGIITAESGSDTGSSNQLLRNGNFEIWSAGTSSAPDGWIFPTGGNITREGTIVKLGSYSCKLHRSGSSGVNRAYQIINGKGINYWKGRTVTFGAWVWADRATAARVMIWDGDAVYSAAYHPGDSAWHWMTVTHTIKSDATEFWVYCYNSNPAPHDGVTYFDGAMLVEGSVAQPFAERNYSEGWIHPSDTTKIDGGDIYTGTVTASQIATGAITVGKLAPNMFGSGQLLDNGNFEDWSAGTSVAPDGWTLGGNATVAKETGAGLFKLGTASAKVTRAGMDCTVRKISSEGNLPILPYVKGRTITYSCWVYATVADRARIYIYDNVLGSTFSSYHTGDSTWQLLTVTAPVDASATVLGVYCAISTGDTSAYFDGAMLVEGEYALPFAEKVRNYGHPSDYTKIDGGDIYTGTVTANSIAANAVTAEKIDVSQLDAITVNTGTLTVDEYINAGDNVTIDGSNEVFKVFGDTVTIEAGVNDDLDWTENGSTKTADLDADDYTPTELAAEVQAKMRAAGNANTTATYSSTTKKITIANDTLTTLTFLWDSGANTATTCGKALGFDVTADDTGALTYTADYQTALRVELGKLS
jgi:hypothetical protein